MYHCHLLHHEDRGMMGRFAVVEPGTPAATGSLPATGPHRH
ncbi:multicopper oxidase domain-containing protein [Streptomyces sp. NPDC054932]